MIAVGVDAAVTACSEGLIPFDGEVGMRGVVGARVVGDEVIHYVGMHVVCDGSVVWVGGVALGLHCVAPFVAGTSGDKDILPERPNLVKYLIDNTCQHLETSASTYSILPQFPTYSIGH